MPTTAEEDRVDVRADLGERTHSSTSTQTGTLRIPTSSPPSSCVRKAACSAISRSSARRSASALTATASATDIRCHCPARRARGVKKNSSRTSNARLVAGIRAPIRYRRKHQRNDVSRMAESTEMAVTALSRTVSSATIVPFTGALRSTDSQQARSALKCRPTASRITGTSADSTSLTRTSDSCASGGNRGCCVDLIGFQRRCRSLVALDDATGVAATTAGGCEAGATGGSFRGSTGSTTSAGEISAASSITSPVTGICPPSNQKTPAQHPIPDTPNQTQGRRPVRGAVRRAGDGATGGATSGTTARSRSAAA